MLGAGCSPSPWASLLHRALWEAEERVWGQHQPGIAQLGMPAPSPGWAAGCFNPIGAVLGEGEALALASRIPARVSGRSVAQRALPDWHVPVAPVRHLFLTPFPAWPRVSVSPIDVSTHTHTVPHCHVLPFTQHTMDHPIHKQRTLDTQPHTAHPSTSTPYTAVCDNAHHLPDTPYQALTTIHTTPQCYTQAPTTPHPRPQTSQRTTHSSASQIPTTQHRSVSHHIHLDFSPPQHEHLWHHRCLL